MTPAVHFKVKVNAFFFFVLKYCWQCCGSKSFSMRIRILHFRSVRIRIQLPIRFSVLCLMTKNCQILQLKFFFKTKFAIFESLGLYEGRPSYRRSHSKEKVQHFKTCGSNFHFQCGSGSKRPNQCGSGSASTTLT
jgi:hypothetical protein